jgi:hypothetical protein
MNGNHRSKLKRLPGWGRQAGGLTIFTAVFVLILMTLMLLYATRVGVFEQRVSGNEMRQKLAFHAAEAAMDYGLEFMLAANTRVLSASTEAQPDGAGNVPPTFRPGWFAAGNILWSACPDNPGADHPCGGDIPAGGTGSFYYDDPDTNTANSYDSIPLDANTLANLPPGTEVRLSAVLCPRTIDDTTCLGAGGVPDPTDPEADTPKYLLWLLAYGYSDCNDDDASGGIDIPGECRGRAHVTQPLGNFENFKGSPTVPLVSKNTLPASGTAEVVPNPNGGGVGVPLSIWANAKAADCVPLDPDGGLGDTIEVEGAFKTCEMHEWYGVDARPADGKCPGAPGQCKCDFPGPEPISYRSGGQEFIGIDILSDPLFPCDLFEFYFGYPSAQYQAVKANATVIDDCGILDEGTPSGFYWFSGDSCDLDNVGTINNPIILLSAANVKTTITGSASFFGILYVADVEDPEGDAFFQPGGDATVYGAAIVDVLFKESGVAGTFRVVYDQGSLAKAGGGGGLGGLSGGWRDFGMPQIVWEP